MNIQVMIGFQIAADILLCAVIIYLLRRFRNEVSASKCGMDQNQMLEFKRLIEDSRQAGAQFVDALAEGRRMFKELAYGLDDREKRLQSLIETSRACSEKLNAGISRVEERSFEGKYQTVIQMAREGLSAGEIAGRTGLADGEVALVIGLGRTKDENP
jgi:hypothetical protein